MISPWIGVGVTIFCGMVGAAVRVFDFTPKQKKVVGWSCIGGAIIGLFLAAYGLLMTSGLSVATSAPEGTGGGKAPAVIAQDHQVSQAGSAEVEVKRARKQPATQDHANDKPSVGRDNNQVNIDQDHVTNSPNVIGSGNTVNISPGANPRAPGVKSEGE